MVRVGTKGQIVNVDGSHAAELFAGARAKVLRRLYHPDGVIVELLNDGPVWHLGQQGEIALRYFIPDKRGSGKPSGTRAHARMTRRKSADSPTEHDYQQAAKFDMKRFGLTLPEALRLVKDKRYPGILKTIEDWRARYGWPAANSSLTRGYVYELLGMQRGSGR